MERKFNIFNNQIPGSKHSIFQHTHAQKSQLYILFQNIFFIPHMIFEYTFNTLYQPDLKLYLKIHTNACFEFLKLCNDRGMKRGQPLFFDLNFN